MELVAKVNVVHQLTVILDRLVKEHKVERVKTIGV